MKFGWSTCRGRVSNDTKNSKGVVLSQVGAWIDMENTSAVLNVQKFSVSKEMADELTEKLQNLTPCLTTGIKKCMKKFSFMPKRNAGVNKDFTSKDQLKKYVKYALKKLNKRKVKLKGNYPVVIIDEDKVPVYYLEDIPTADCLEQFLTRNTGCEVCFPKEKSQVKLVCKAITESQRQTKWEAESHLCQTETFEHRSTVGQEDVDGQYTKKPTLSRFGSISSIDSNDLFGDGGQGRDTALSIVEELSEGTPVDEVDEIVDVVSHTAFGHSGSDSDTSVHDTKTPMTDVSLSSFLEGSSVDPDSSDDNVDVEKISQQKPEETGKGRKECKKDSGDKRVQDCPQRSSSCKSARDSEESGHAESQKEEQISRMAEGPSNTSHCTTVEMDKLGTSSGLAYQDKITSVSENYIVIKKSEIKHISLKSEEVKQLIDKQFHYFSENHLMKEEMKDTATTTVSYTSMNIRMGEKIENCVKAEKETGFRALEGSADDGRLKTSKGRYLRIEAKRRIATMKNLQKSNKVKLISSVLSSQDEGKKDYFIQKFGIMQFADESFEILPQMVKDDDSRQVVTLRFIKIFCIPVENWGKVRPIQKEKWQKWMQKKKRRKRKTQIAKICKKEKKEITDKKKETMKKECHKLKQGKEIIQPSCKWSSTQFLKSFGNWKTVLLVLLGYFIGKGECAVPVDTDNDVQWWVWLMEFLHSINSSNIIQLRVPIVFEDAADFLQVAVIVWYANDAENITQQALHMLNVRFRGLDVEQVVRGPRPLPPSVPSAGAEGASGSRNAETRTPPRIVQRGPATQQHHTSTTPETTTNVDDSAGALSGMPAGASLRDSDAAVGITDVDLKREKCRFVRSPHVCNGSARDDIPYVQNTEPRRTSRSSSRHPLDRYNSPREDIPDVQRVIDIYRKGSSTIIYRLRVSARECFSIYDNAQFSTFLSSIGCNRLNSLLEDTDGNEVDFIQAGTTRVRLALVLRDTVSSCLDEVNLEVR